MKPTFIKVGHTTTSEGYESAVAPYGGFTVTLEKNKINIYPKSSLERSVHEGLLEQPYILM